MDEYAIINQ